MSFKPLKTRMVIPPNRKIVRTKKQLRDIYGIGAFTMQFADGAIMNFNPRWIRAGKEGRVFEALIEEFDIHGECVINSRGDGTQCACLPTCEDRNCNGECGCKWCYNGYLSEGDV